MECKELKLFVVIVADIWDMFLMMDRINRLKILYKFCFNKIQFKRMKIGTVKEYDRRKGFGFISSDDNQDYFVHISGLGSKDLKNRGLFKGQKILFDIDFGMKGDKAVNIRPK